MNWETREKLTKELHRKELEIASTKGKEYASKDDCLSNFKTIASLLNKATPITCTCPNCGGGIEVEISPKVVLAVYMMKHLLAILDYIGRGESLSEQLFDRILDLRTYGMLLYGLDMDDKGE